MRFWCRQGLNFEDYTEKARSWVADGRIGEVRHIVCQMGSPLHDLFAGEPMMETADHLFRPPASTWADPQKAGGYAWGQMSHSLAWMIHVSGLTVAQVYCAAGQSPTGVDFYDAATARASNGATIALSGASTVPKHRGMHTDVRIYGTEGMLLFDNQRATVQLWRLDGEDDALTLERPEYDGALPVQVFAKLCAGLDVINASNADCGAEVTATIAALYKSARNRQTGGCGMKLSLTAWSLPSCTLPEAAAISNALGIGALDVGLFYRSALDKAEILSDPAAAAGRLAGLGVDIPNYYHLFGEGLDGRNLAAPGTLNDNLKDLAQVLTFADAAGIGTVFILPGIVNPGQSRQDAEAESIRSLGEMQALAADHEATLCIEPHVHSFAESPAIVQRLVDATGIRLALDYSHFACLGYRQAEIDPLAAHAAHVHLRQAKMGALQTKFDHGTLNFPAMFGTLRDVGYTGALAIEPVHQDYMNTLFEDVLTEIIALRDCFNSWKEGS